MIIAYGHGIQDSMGKSLSGIHRILQSSKGYIINCDILDISDIKVYSPDYIKRNGVMSKIYSFFNLDKVEKPFFVMQPSDLQNKRFFFNCINNESRLAISYKPLKEDEGKIFIF